MKIICANCGDKINTDYFRAGNNQTAFCSMQCVHEGLMYFGPVYIRKTVIPITFKV